MLDRFYSAGIQKIKLKTPADWLIEKDDLLYVRFYNTDDVFRIEIRD